MQTVFVDAPLEVLHERVARRNLDRPPGTFSISAEELDEWVGLFEAPTEEELTWLPKPAAVRTCPGDPQARTPKGTTYARDSTDAGAMGGPTSVGSVFEGCGQSLCHVGLECMAEDGPSRETVERVHGRFEDSYVNHGDQC